MILKQIPLISALDQGHFRFHRTCSYVQDFALSVRYRSFRSVFRFSCKKTSVFLFWCSLRFADFSLFRIWFSVFVENTSGFSVLLSDLVFQCSYFVLFEFQFLFDLSGNWSRIAAKRQSYWEEFLRAIVAISQAYSVHNKGASYEKKTAEEAIGLVHHCKTVLEEHIYQIRAESNITGALNGPQGHVSATANSVQLMEWGLGRLADILGEFDYQALDLAVWH